MNKIDLNYISKTQEQKEKENKEFLAKVRQHTPALDALNKFALSQNFILSLIVDEWEAYCRICSECILHPFEGYHADAFKVVAQLIAKHEHSDKDKNVAFLKYRIQQIKQFAKKQKINEQNCQVIQGVKWVKF